MSLFALLEKFDIHSDRLNALSEREIIRIEKQLKAEARLGGEVDLNEIEQIIDVLKNHAPDLKVLYSNSFKMLRAILTYPNKFLILKDKLVLPTDLNEEKLKVFIWKYFEKELRIYAENCVKKEYYNSLYALLEFKPVLSSQYLDELQQKLRSRLVFAVECFRISASNLETKADFVANPFFFRALSSLGSLSFEDEVIDLLSIILERSEYIQLQLRVAYAMGSFKATGTSLKETLLSNMRRAYTSEVREVPFSPITQKKTGSTSLPRGGASRTYSSSVSSSSKGVKTNNPARAPRTVIIVMILIVVVIFMINKCQRDRNNSYDNWGYQDTYEPLETNVDQDFEDFLEEYSDQPEVTDEIDEYDYEEEEEERLPFSPRLDSKSEDFKDIINYLHSDKVNILKEENIPFETKATEMNKRTRFSGGTKNVLIINKTYKRVLLMTKSARWEQFTLLEPDDTVVVSDITRAFRVYMGDVPQLVTYVNGNDDTLTHFRFKECSNEELEEFNEFFNLSSYWLDRNKNIVEILYGRHVSFSVNGEDR